MGGGGAPTALQTFALTRVLVRPPVTPPYPLLCFYATCAAAAAYELVFDVLRDGRGVPYGALALGALQLCVLGTLIWIAGTYPLRDMWPGPDVARPFEVSSHNARCSERGRSYGSPPKAPLQRFYNAGRQRGPLELVDVLVR